MKHLPLKPTQPRTRMDSKKKAELREDTRKHKTRRKSYNKQYYAKNKREILRWAKKARERRLHGDHRLTRYNQIAGEQMKTVSSELSTRHRTTNEARRYLDGVKSMLTTASITLDLDKLSGGGGSKSVRPTKTYNVPRIEVDDDTNIILTELTIKMQAYDNLIRELGARLVDWRRVFSKSADVKPLLTEGAATLKRVKSTYTKLVTRLNALTESLVPERFDTLCASLYQTLAEGLQYEYLKDSYVATSMGDALRISYEIEVIGLSVGDNYTDSYYIVVTLVQSETATSLHLTTHQEAEVPGTYDVGQSFNTLNGALELVDTLMELDHFDVQLYDTPLDIKDDIDLGDYKKDILKFGINTGTQTLELHTMRFMDDEALEPILEAVLAQFPKSIPLGKVRIKTFAQQTFSLTSMTEPDFGELPVSVVQQSDNKWLIESRDVIAKVNAVKANLKKALTIAKRLGEVSTPQSVYTVAQFRLTGTKRTDLKQLREFVTNLGEHLNPRQIRSVRKALGI